MKIKGRVFPLIASLIFFLVGVALLSLVITSLANEPKYVKTTATVVSAEVRYSYEGKLEAVSTFEYFADGKRYEAKTAATNANSARLEGETFTVKYDPNDPEKLQSGGAVFYGVLAFGIIFACVGGGLFIALITGKLN